MGASNSRQETEQLRNEISILEGRVEKLERDHADILRNSETRLDSPEKEKEKEKEEEEEDDEGVMEIGVISETESEINKHQRVYEAISESYFQVMNLLEELTTNSSVHRKQVVIISRILELIGQAEKMIGAGDDETLIKAYPLYPTSFNNHQNYKMLMETLRMAKSDIDLEEQRIRMPNMTEHQIEESVATQKRIARRWISLAKHILNEVKDHSRVINKLKLPGRNVLY